MAGPFGVYSPRLHPIGNDRFFPFNWGRVFRQLFCAPVSRGKASVATFVQSQNTASGGITASLCTHERCENAFALQHERIASAITTERVRCQDKVFRERFRGIAPEEPKAIEGATTTERVLLPNLFKTICAEFSPSRMKTRVYLVMFIAGFLLSSGFALPGVLDLSNPIIQTEASITAFSDGSAAKTFEFDSWQNQGAQIVSVKIPKNATITSAVLQLTGAERPSIFSDSFNDIAYYSLYWSKLTSGLGNAVVTTGNLQVTVNPDEIAAIGTKNNTGNYRKMTFRVTGDSINCGNGCSIQFSAGLMESPLLFWNQQPTGFSYFQISGRFWKDGADILRPAKFKILTRGDNLTEINDILDFYPGSTYIVTVELSGNMLNLDIDSTTNHLISKSYAIANLDSKELYPFLGAESTDHSFLPIGTVHYDDSSYESRSYPASSNIAVDSQSIWNQTTEIKSALVQALLNTTKINDWLSQCTPKADGNCSLPLSFYASLGMLAVNSLQFNYTTYYNASSVIAQADRKAWKKTSGFAVGDAVQKAKQVNFSNPQQSLQINYVSVSDTATKCAWDGIPHSVVAIEGKTYCNITAENFTWSSAASNSLWDDTMADEAVPLTNNSIHDDPLAKQFLSDSKWLYFTKKAEIVQNPSMPAAAFANVSYVYSFPDANCSVTNQNCKTTFNISKPSEDISVVCRAVPMKLTKFNGATTTDFGSITDLSSVSDFTLENTSYGKITFAEPVNLSEGADIDANVEISSNKISVNLPALNKPAVLSLYNISFSNPKILKDGADCPANVCKILGKDNGILVFSVIGFSTYSAANIEPQPPGPTYGGGGGFGGYSAPPKKEFNITLIQPQKEADAGDILVKFETITSTKYCYLLLDGKPVANLTGGQKEHVLKNVGEGTHSLYLGCADDSNNTAYLLTSFYAKAQEIAESGENKTTGEEPQPTAVTGLSILGIFGDNVFWAVAFAVGFVCIFVVWRYQPAVLPKISAIPRLQKRIPTKPVQIKKIAEAKKFAESFRQQPGQIEKPILLQQICKFLKEYGEKGGEKLNFTVPELAAKVGATPLAVRTAVYRGIELGVLDKYASGKFQGYRLGKYGMKTAEMDNFRSYGDFEKALKYCTEKNN